MLATSMASNVMSSWRPPCHVLSLSKSSRMGSLSTHFTSMRIAVGQSIHGRKPVKTLTVMMGKREQSLQEIRGKNNEDINEEIIDLKGEIHMLRFMKSTKQEYKASDYKRMRKQIARLLTVRRERELEQGINKKQSRKMDREWKRSVVVRPPPSLRKMQEENAAEQNKGS
ncbi:hypothetical protein SUGI_0179200 [Cryptomeria japonica]|uniref:large ribosomal subunit protein uL29c n=1 Tax=Cryptomeria japonica TaxID=3369 RepID=UPI002408D8F7|nr:large ribosomal subunit protein uL29c [Cryptomeria japonica]GLJ11883.1 hypothetical protein SUGI_0179200 [Cryptomeria japonica]